MRIDFHDITIIIAILTLATILVVCIANHINSSIIYLGITSIAGLAGYTIGKTTKKKE